MTLVCWSSCFNFIHLIPTDLSLWSIFPFLSLCVALCGAEVQEVGYKCGVKLLDWSSSSGTCWRTVAGFWRQACWYLVQLKLGAAWRSYDKQIFSYHRSPQWNLGVPVNLACEPSGDGKRTCTALKYCLENQAVDVASVCLLQTVCLEQNR